MMRSVTYSMAVSLDGCIVGPDGGATLAAEAAALGLIDEYRSGLPGTGWRWHSVLSPGHEAHDGSTPLLCFLI